MENNETPEQSQQSEMVDAPDASSGSATVVSSANTPADTPAETAPLRSWDLTFHGAGNEYFRIWVVNLALTVLTLGIFSAWAKVRTNRYFYGNTELAGDRFDYLASPIAILKGRLIAVAALVIYTLAQMFSTTLTVIFFIVLIVLLPVLVVRAVRFSAAMTAWRGIRLSFGGTYREAAYAYIGWPIFGILTMGMGMPYAWWRQNHYLINNYKYGTAQGRSSTTAGDFYIIALILGGLMFAGIFLMAILIGVVIAMSGDADADESGAVIVVATMLVYLAIYLVMYVVYQALYFKTVYDKIHIEGSRVRTTVSVVGWGWVAATNSVLILLTLGFYYPWARVRMTRYIIAHMHIESNQLDDFYADKNAQTSALGEEVGEAFDLGLGI